MSFIWDKINEKHLRKKLFLRKENGLFKHNYELYDFRFVITTKNKNKTKPPNEIYRINSKVLM